jgi:hypothetical protein
MWATPSRCLVSESRLGTSGVWWLCGKRSPGIVGRVEQERRDDEKLVDEAVEDMQSDVEEMQERSEELGDRVEETRSDWDSKQQDNAVAGAQPAIDEAERPPDEEPADGDNGQSGQQEEETSGEEQSEEQAE